MHMLKFMWRKALVKQINKCFAAEGNAYNCVYIHPSQRVVSWNVFVYLPQRSQLHSYSIFMFMHISRKRCWRTLSPSSRWTLWDVYPTSYQRWRWCIMLMEGRCLCGNVQLGADHTNHWALFEHLHLGNGNLCWDLWVSLTARVAASAHVFRGPQQTVLSEMKMTLCTSQRSCSCEYGCVCCEILLLSQWMSPGPEESLKSAVFFCTAQIATKSVDEEGKNVFWGYKLCVADCVDRKQ